MRRKATLLVVLFTSGAGLGQMQGPIAAQQEIDQARSAIPDFGEVTTTL